MNDSTAQQLDKDLCHFLDNLLIQKCPNTTCIHEESPMVNEPKINEPNTETETLIEHGAIFTAS